MSTCNVCFCDVCLNRIKPEHAQFFVVQRAVTAYPASILHKSTSGRYRPVSYPDGPMMARYRFT